MNEGGGRRPLSRRMWLASAQRNRRIYELRVGRVLEVLAEGELLAQAGAQLGSRSSVVAECPFVDLVWGDRRVARRVAQLARVGVVVERITHAEEVRGRRFERRRLVVRYRELRD